MLTSEFCSQRRRELRQKLRGFLDGPLVLSDPIHLRYLANFHIDPYSTSADCNALLVIDPEGQASIHYDNRLPRSVELAHVEERIPINWYDGRSPSRGPRRLILQQFLREQGGRIHDCLSDPLSEVVINAISKMRRRKYPDEIDVLRLCMNVGEAGHAWALKNVCAGMTELEVYEGISRACNEAAKQPVIVYGDFAVSPGPKRRGGMPTLKILENGETLILDFSVILHGYRCDLTNTLVVGGKPTPQQNRLMEITRQAMAAGEAKLRPGVSCLDVYRALRGVFDREGMADFFPHHAGHGLGLKHPEAPFLVEQANETLHDGDVVTLEPGLYINGIGGIRIERNYLVTETGFENLSNHFIGLTAT